jgi:prepilin-type processing-associated H-X9-DG protein
MCRRKSIGFTLVELLVVVGIVTALIAVLLPALAGARRQANAIRCQANLSQLGHALVLYTQLSGYYPGSDAFYSAPGGWIDAYAVWPARLRTLLGGERGVFYCPAQDPSLQWPGAGPNRMLKGVNATFALQFGYEKGEPVIDLYNRFSYGYNGWGDGGRMSAPLPWQLGLGGGIYPDRTIAGWKDCSEMRASRVRYPSWMIAIADTSVDGLWDPVICPSVDNPLLWPGDIHRGGANVLFCDGHVQWYPRDELVNIQDREHNERRWRWNNTGPWLPTKT